MDGNLANGSHITRSHPYITVKSRLGCQLSYGKMWRRIRKECSWDGGATETSVNMAHSFACILSFDLLAMLLATSAARGLSSFDAT